MKIAYVTAETPYGRRETFILDEMTYLKECADIFIVPRKPPKDIYNKSGEDLKKYTLWLPLVNAKMIINFLSKVFSKKFWSILIMLVKGTGNVKNTLKNFIILPKCFYTAKNLKDQNVTHIHAHWGTTTSTMAFILSKLTDIPWSFTVHRSDIPTNNMLKEKVKDATFCRTINREGRDEVIQIVGRELEDKVKVIHMGVKVEGAPDLKQSERKEIYKCCCPGRLTYKKGHKYLVEAAKILSDRGVKNFKILIIGDGPLESGIQELVDTLRVNDFIEMTGRKSHEELIDLYKNNLIDMVVLPSIIADDGDKEGIPVALMEPMSYGIPTVATKTGGIPELLEDGAGALIEQKDSKAIADALELMFKDSDYRQTCALTGYKKVNTDFNIDIIIKTLLDEMKN
ncbi:MAG: glycosyltransferase family 4 protein [Clostridia bacterium]|nr:glycosyltransferase family 4 protein [Clostridia bacterium]